MVGRAVVAVVTPGGFLGVCHDEASEPWNLGNVLLKKILEEEGDLLKVTTELVFLCPGGWRSFAERARRTPPVEFDEPSLYGPDELRGQEWLSWLYLFDAVQRKLTIYAGNPYLHPDTKLGPLARVVFEENGRARPGVFSQPPPPWPGLPVAAGWSQDSLAARKLRRRIDRAMSGPDGGAALRTSLGELLCTVLTTLAWQEPQALESDAELALRESLGEHRSDPRKPITTAEDPLCVPFAWDNDDHYWEVDLNGQLLRYPPASVRQFEAPLAVYRLDGCTGEITELEPVLRRAAAQLGEASSPFQRFGRSVGFWKSPADTATAAVDAIVDSLTFARGDTSGLHWWLLDWIRLGQVALEEAEGQEPFPERNRAAVDGGTR